MAEKCEDSCSSLPEGGFDCDFIDSPPESLTCAICLLPFRDPVLVSCCGAKYCQLCMRSVHEAGKPCPLCKQSFEFMLDRSYQRKVLGLLVRCSRRSEGCKWEGELRHLQHHEQEECEWAVVDCRFKCGKCGPRCFLQQHEREECPEQPLDVKLHRIETKLVSQLTELENKMEKMKNEFHQALLEEQEKRRQEVTALTAQVHQLQLQQTETHTKLSGVCSGVPGSFHRRHGHSVVLSHLNTTAQRTSRLKDGLVYSRYPVPVDKLFQVRILELLNMYFSTGSICIGFTTQNPDHCQIPNDLYYVRSPEYWFMCGKEAFHDSLVYELSVDLKALSVGQSVGCHVSRSGHLHLHIDGCDKETVLSGLPTDVPLWGVVDLYGKFAKIESDYTM